jgi:hydroxyacylglutathione hydrolase
MKPKQWFEGIHLLGQFDWVKTGCWLLEHNGEAAILEVPPAGQNQKSAAEVAKAAVKKFKVRVKHILCTHAHQDHFTVDTFREMRYAFPDAEPVLEEGFRRWLPGHDGIRYTNQPTRLELAGEPLYLVPAPKHSHTDTIVIFRGTACTGDWELNTIRSVHDGRRWGVPRDIKEASVRMMTRFSRDFGYQVHRIFSVHGNDRRENVHFTQLMEETLIDRALW